MDNLGLIDWREVGFAALWIVGLAVVLAALGFADYNRQTAKRGFRQELKRPAYQLPIQAGLAMFCLGQLGASQPWWQTALWGGLALAFIGMSVGAFRQIGWVQVWMQDFEASAGQAPSQSEDAGADTLDHTQSIETHGAAAGTEGREPSVLLVCTANRCRSPMAEALLRQLLEREDIGCNCRVELAGTWAMEGDPATEFAQETMRERGLDISGHRSRRVTRDLLARQDLVLVMEAGHLEALETEFPDLADRFYMLTALAGPAHDIADPVGGSLEDYRSVAGKLDGVLRRGLPKIKRALSEDGARSGTAGDGA